MNLAVSDTKSISSKAELRKSARQRVHLFVKYRSANSLEYFTAQCSNLSAGGMFIASQRLMAQGSLLKVECESQAISSDLKSVVQVIWVRGEKEDGPPGMGVKFVGANHVHAAEAIEKLLQMCTPSIPAEDNKTIDFCEDDADGYLMREAGKSSLAEPTRDSIILDETEQEDTPINDLNAQPLQSLLESGASVTLAEEALVTEDPMLASAKAPQDSAALCNRGVPASWIIETEPVAPVKPPALDKDLFAEEQNREVPESSQPTIRTGVYALPIDEDYSTPFPWSKAIIRSLASLVILGVLVGLYII